MGNMVFKGSFSGRFRGRDGLRCRRWYCWMFRWGRDGGFWLRWVLVRESVGLEISKCHGLRIKWLWMVRVR